MTFHRLKIRHFQSLHDVDLELHPFTVIVGPSSSGKSAFARALRTLISNRRGTEWITHGERLASITAETEHGTVTLTRSRQTSSTDNAYTITRTDRPDAPAKFTKLGGETPQEVSDFLGIPAGTGTTPPINFASQFDKPFLLDDSAAEVARTLGSLTNVSVIFDGARESNRRKLHASQTLKTRSQDLEVIEARIPEFRALKAQDVALQAAEARIAEARGIQESIARLDKALATVETLTPTLERLESLANIEVPDESKVVEAVNALQRLQNALGRVPVLGRAVKAAEEAYLAAEAHQGQLEDQYRALTGEMTADVYAFVDRQINAAFTREIEGGKFVELRHAVDIFVQFLEMRAGA